MGGGPAPGSLAGRDLAARCAEGRLDAKGQAGSRRGDASGGLTGVSSSRWAGAMHEEPAKTPGSLRAGIWKRSAATLKARVRKIETRVAVPAAKKQGPHGRVRDPGRALRQDDPPEGAEKPPRQCREAR